MLVRRAGIDQPREAIELRLIYLRWLSDPETQSGRVKVPHFVARHIRNVPGRKTDVKDAEWIAELVCRGLIRPSFVPPKLLRELRELLRYRRKLTEAQATERNRLQKQLEIANIKLGSVATDVFGVSGRAIVRALIDNTTSPVEMADLARGRLRSKRGELTHALNGRLDNTQRFPLSMQLRRVGIECCQRDIFAADFRGCTRMHADENWLSVRRQVSASAGPFRLGMAPACRRLAGPTPISAISTAATTQSIL